jgi:predicted RNA-binding protein associated with RNAse of E/G family
LPEQNFREVKRTIAGVERLYDCQSIAVSSRMAAVRFVFTRPLKVAGRTFEPGGYTEGFFWRARHYNLYHIVSAGGEPILDRFDIIDRVKIRPGGVSYDDLLLDILIYADGRVVIEDEDELQEALQSGLVDKRRLALIRRTETLLLTRGHQIVERALAELATFSL